MDNISQRRGFFHRRAAWRAQDARDKKPMPELQDTLTNPDLQLGCLFFGGTIPPEIRDHIFSYVLTEDLDLARPYEEDTHYTRPGLTLETPSYKARIRPIVPFPCPGKKIQTLIRLLHPLRNYWGGASTSAALQAKPHLG